MSRITRWRSTRTALAWSLGSVVLATLALAFYLLVVDLLRYDGHCPGSLLPFLADPQPRTCAFTDYFDRSGLFALRIVVATVWPIALLFVGVAVGVGMARDRQRRGASDAPERSRGDRP